MHPLENFPLVQKASIKIAVLFDLLARQEAEGANAVVEVDKHYIVVRLANDIGAVVVATRVFDDIGAVIVGVRVRRISTTLYVEPDWKLRSWSCI